MTVPIPILLCTSIDNNRLIHLIVSMVTESVTVIVANDF